MRQRQGTAHTVHLVVPAIEAAFEDGLQRLLRSARVLGYSEPQLWTGTVPQGLRGHRRST